MQCFFSCKNTNCLKQYTEEDMMEIFTKLYSMQTKTEQDIYIQSLMEICPIERERPRPEAFSRKPRNFNVRYHVVHNGIRTKVCKEGFLQTYGYTLSNVPVLQISWNAMKTQQTNGAQMCQVMQYLDQFYLV